MPVSLKRPSRNRRITTPSLGAAESSSAVARPRVLSLMMHGGGKLRMGDAMQIDVGAPSEAARPGSSVLGKRAAYGSDGERWAERMLRTITENSRVR